MSTLASPAFGRVEASIFGESALIDRETGRVFWECGNSNTLYESSVTPKLDRFGVEHVQATVLTVLITLAFLSVLSGWLKRIIDSFYYATTKTSSPYSSSWTAKTLSVVVVLAECTILKLPKIDNKWWVSAFVMLYFLESYQCSTRCFLANIVSNATDLDAYIDGLKQEPPVVTWKVQTFHYELRRMFTFPRMLRLLFRSLKKSKSKSRLATQHELVPNNNNNASTTSSTATTITSPPLPTLELPRKSSRHTKPMFPITRKVVTNEASEFYHYGSHSDKTIIGIWSRPLPPLVSDDDDNDEGAVYVPPFRKISLSKTLVLSDKRSREDYFRQQTEFVTRYDREDEFAEFSTSIDVAGYRPRLLVAWPLLSYNNGSSSNNSSSIGYKHNHKHKQRRLVRLSVFWAFTCLGMTVPYRIWFKRHCDLLRVTVVKETNANANANGKTASDNYNYLRSWFST